MHSKFNEIQQKRKQTDPVTEPYSTKCTVPRGALSLCGRNRGPDAGQRDGGDHGRHGYLGERECLSSGDGGSHVTENGCRQFWNQERDHGDEDLKPVVKSKCCFPLFRNWIYMYLSIKIDLKV